MTATREEYLEMLRAARESAPPVIVSGERFVPPRPVVVIEGRQTHIVNFREICNELNRDPQMVARYLSKELGSPYFLTENSRKLILSRRIDPHLVEARVKRFIDRYVICPLCKRPDTKLIKVKKALILKCEACGAETPVPKV
ncbi:MAG: translation initiation factor IF-2 subunit beta [Thermoproteota archaeon]|nr:MAG: translation initiation factor IF-2 subunit beta [Candidatus Korarchaeota archaeon]HDI85894.1 translation initiation factor IF-2 subunit beta [Candidatus Korarchaeota archaeon]